MLIADLLPLGEPDIDLTEPVRTLGVPAIVGPDGEHIADYVLFESDPIPKVVGPTAYMAGDDRIAIRYDTPCAAVALDYYMSLPPQGTAAYTIGIPEDVSSNSYFFFGGPVEFEYWFDDNRHNIRASVMGATWLFSEDARWISPGWHTVHVAWDSILRRRELYLDGSMVGDYNGGDYNPSGNPFGMQTGGFADANAGDGRISIARAQVHDERFSYDQLVNDVTSELAALTTPPLTTFLPLIPDFAVKWDEPAEPVTGWLLRFADRDGNLREFQLPADVRQMRFLDYFDADPEGGTVHLHALNDHGISTPAHLEF